ncbi:hypothetical protein IKF15_02895 [Candidatus Saccharibacteria bacterium]|nr:hypothetical protein [Candidatus Saccharibacteria bacterium]
MINHEIGHHEDGGNESKDREEDAKINALEAMQGKMGESAESDAPKFEKEDIASLEKIKEQLEAIGVRRDVLESKAFKQYILPSLPKYDDMDDDAWKEGEKIKVDKVVQEQDEFGFDLRDLTGVSKGKDLDVVRFHATKDGGIAQTRRYVSGYHVGEEMAGRRDEGCFFSYDSVTVNPDAEGGMSVECERMMERINITSDNGEETGTSSFSGGVEEAKFDAEGSKTSRLVRHYKHKVGEYNNNNISYLKSKIKLGGGYSDGRATRIVSRKTMADLQEMSGEWERYTLGEFGVNTETSSGDVSLKRHVSGDGLDQAYFDY